MTSQGSSKLLIVGSVRERPEGVINSYILSFFSPSFLFLCQCFGLSVSARVRAQGSCFFGGDESLCLRCPVVLSGRLEFEGLRGGLAAGVTEEMENV